MELRNTRGIRIVAIFFLGFSLAACGGGEGDSPLPSGKTPDRSPAPIAFAVSGIDNMVPGFSMTSAPVIVKDIDEGISVPAAVVGGELQLNGKGDFVAGPVEVRAGDTVIVRVTAPATFEGKQVATLTLGEGKDAQSAEFTLKTGHSSFSVEPGFKSLTFKWDAMVGAERFELYENADGVSGFSKLDVDIAGDAVNASLANRSVHRIDWHNARYQLHACDASRCTLLPQHELPLMQKMSSDAAGVIKASNAGSEDYFGFALDVSSDGRRMVVGAYGESSASTETPDDDSVPNTGAVYVYEKTPDGPWIEQTVLKASNAETGDVFGISVSISGDGEIIAVGASQEDSSATGIGGDADDNAAENSGAVYIYARQDDGSWAHVAYLKASNADAGDRFGYPVVLNGDGTRLAVGAEAEQSLATGVNPTGGQEDNSDPRDETEFYAAGAIYVFSRQDENWLQEAYIKASDSDPSDRFGFALDLDAAGDTLAVGAPGEDSSAAGVNGDGSLNNFSGSGAVYVFEHNGDTWLQRAYIKASNTGARDGFGGGVSLADDGETLVVGASSEDSDARGINGDGSDNSMSGSGAAYVYRMSEEDWSFADYIKASNTHVSDNFGYAVAISGDSRTIAIGASREGGYSAGVNGDETNTDNTILVGAVYVFQQSGDTWVQRSYVKPPVSQDRLFFGGSLALSRRGDTLLSHGYDRAAVVSQDGDLISDCDAAEPVNCAENSGAVFVY